MAENDTVEIGSGPIKFNLHYSDQLNDQGVTMNVYGEVDGQDVEILRFDCFDHAPHYHYGPEKLDERFMLDKTTEGDPLDWTLAQLRSRMQDMTRRAGYEELAGRIDDAALQTDLDSVESAAGAMALEQRSTVRHDRGDVIIEAGSVRFGVEFRELASDRGVAIHVLGDAAGEEVELLTFDCFENAPHYHYGPMAKNQRLYLDVTTAPDSLRWALDLFKGGKLAAMLDRAGYSDHAARLNPAMVAQKVEELESVALKFAADNAR